MINMAFCAKCSDAKTKAIKDAVGVRGFSLVGCKKLSKKQWEEGLSKGMNEPWNQKNCPLLGRKA
jgi:hypothetical protein